MIFRSIASGSSGNCIFVGSSQAHILIDAGVSAKRIEEGLRDTGFEPGELDGIFITHEHSDHISGIGVLMRKYNIPVYATVETVNAMLHDKYLGRVNPDLLKFISPNKRLAVKDLTVEPFSTSHDAANPVCYLVSDGEHRFGLATDLGEYTEEIREKLSGLDILVLEANHDRNMLMVGRYPYYLKQRIAGSKGHLSNDDAARLLTQLDGPLPSVIALAHLSKENNYPELALETVRFELAERLKENSGTKLFVARRDEPSELFMI